MQGFTTRKVILIVCLLMVGAMSFISCNSSGISSRSETIDTTATLDYPTETEKQTESEVVTNPPTETETDPVGTEETEQPLEPVRTVSLKLHGIDLNEYTVICAVGPWRSWIAQDAAAFAGQDTEFDYLSGLHFANTLKSRYGVELKVQIDADTQRTKNEILIGKTSRGDVSEEIVALESGGYFAKQISRGYAVSGDDYGVTWHAVEFLLAEIERLVQESEESAVTVELSEISLSGTYDLTVIGCIGDSITEGVGSGHSKVYSYPEVLQRLLWKDYKVYNYGNSGKTLRPDLYTENGGREGWMYTEQYRQCYENIEAIDIILLMLGTNDSNRVATTTSDKVWGEDDTQMFIRSGEYILKSFAEKNPDIKYYLMNCPVYYGTGAFGSEAVCLAQVQMFDALVAGGYDVEWVDMRSFTNEYLGRSLFPDLLHPNNEGYRRIGFKMMSVLTNTEYPLD